MAEKVHVWDRDELNGKPIKAGDVVRIVDSLNPDERATVEKLRALGPYKIHDARAQVLERMAAGARANADVLKLYEMYPFLEGEAPTVKPSWQLAQLVMIALVLCGVVALAAAQYRRTSPTLPSSVGAHTPPVLQKLPEEVSRAGRVGKR